MNKEQLFFIEILNCYINKREIEAIDGIDWNLIYQYGRMQNLIGIVYITCKKIIPQEYLNEFSGPYASNIFSSRNRKQLTDKIEKEFNNNDIDYLMVKGAEICKLYHHPDLRTMGDTDIVVRKQDQDKASDILVNNLGFEKQMDGYEWVYYKNGFEYELHSSLVYEKDNYNGEYLNDCWKHIYKDDNGNSHLNWNFHLIFLIFHIRKHIIAEGIGFRQFFDIAFVCLKKELDWNYIKNTLEKLNLYKFGVNVFTMINKWFGISTPLIDENYDEEFINDVTEKIFKDGVFGHENKENVLNEAEVIYSSDSKFKIFARIKYFLKRTFPSKDELRSREYLLWMKKINYFLPIAWIYRLFFVATHKERRDNFINKATISKEDIEKRKTTMDKWGI